MFDRLSAYRPQALAALRIMTALLFIEHGTQKFFNFPPAEQPFGDLMNLIGLAGLLEVIGGLLILVGFQTQNPLFDMFLREDQLRRRIDRNFVHLLNRPLTLGIKGTDGIHLVAPSGLSGCRYWHPS